MLVVNALNSALYNMWNWNDAPGRLSVPVSGWIRVNQKWQTFIFRCLKGWLWAFFGTWTLQRFGLVSFFFLNTFLIPFLIDSLGSYLTFRSFIFFFQYVGMERRLFSALFLYTRQQKEGNLLIPHMHRQMHSCFYCCCTEFVGFFFFLSSLEINGWCLVFCALTVWTAEAGLDKWERLHKAKTFLSVVMWLFFFLFNVLWRCSMGFLCELLPVDPVLQRWI